MDSNTAQTATIKLMGSKSEGCGCEGKVLNEGCGGQGVQNTQHPHGMQHKRCLHEHLAG